MGSSKAALCKNRVPLTGGPKVWGPHVNSPMRTSAQRSGSPTSYNNGSHLQQDNAFLRAQKSLHSSSSEYWSGEFKMVPPLNIWKVKYGKPQGAWQIELKVKQVRSTMWSYWEDVSIISPGSHKHYNEQPDSKVWRAFKGCMNIACRLTHQEEWVTRDSVETMDEERPAGEWRTSMEILEK